MSITRETKNIIGLVIAISFLGVIILFLIYHGGGNIIVDGNIDAKAFSTYKKICDVETTSGEHEPDSPNFVQEAAKHREFFSRDYFEPQKVLVIDSDGGPFLSPKGMGGVWNPQRLYDVQLVVCVGKERSFEGTGMCNGETFVTYGRTIKLYAAKTGEFLENSVLFEPDECSSHDDRQSFNGIVNLIEEATICTNCIVVP